MSNNNISKYRSEVIERAINIEWIMSAIICQHYFKKVIMPFLLEVLYDEYFSFALKRRILEKIVRNFDKKKLQDLNRLNTIRNYFAHCNQQIFEGSSIPSENNMGKVIDPRNLDKVIDFEKLYGEFMGIIGELEKYLAGIFIKIGGELEIVKDNEFVKVEHPSKL
jgi:hypothetical protein